MSAEAPIPMQMPKTDARGSMPFAKVDKQAAPHSCGGGGCASCAAKCALNDIAGEKGVGALLGKIRFTVSAESSGDRKDEPPAAASVRDAVSRMGDLPVGKPTRVTTESGMSYFVTAQAGGSEYSVLPLAQRKPREVRSAPKAVDSAPAESTQTVQEDNVTSPTVNEKSPETNAETIAPVIPLRREAVAPKVEVTESPKTEVVEERKVSVDEAPAKPDNRPAEKVVSKVPKETTAVLSKQPIVERPAEQPTVVSEKAPAAKPVESIAKAAPAPAEKKVDVPGPTVVEQPQLRRTEPAEHPRSVIEKSANVKPIEVKHAPVSRVEEPVVSVPQQEVPAVRSDRQESVPLVDVPVSQPKQTQETAQHNKSSVAGKTNPRPNGGEEVRHEVSTPTVVKAPAEEVVPQQGDEKPKLKSNKIKRAIAAATTAAVLRAGGIAGMKDSNHDTSSTKSDNGISAVVDRPVPQGEARVPVPNVENRKVYPAPQRESVAANVVDFAKAPPVEAQRRVPSGEVKATPVVSEKKQVVTESQPRVQEVASTIVVPEIRKAPVVVKEKAKGTPRPETSSKNNLITKEQSPQPVKVVEKVRAKATIDTRPTVSKVTKDVVRQVETKAPAVKKAEAIVIVQKGADVKKAPTQITEKSRIVRPVIATEIQRPSRNVEKADVTQTKKVEAKITRVITKEEIAQVKQIHEVTKRVSRQSREKATQQLIAMGVETIVLPKNVTKEKKKVTVEKKRIIVSNNEKGRVVIVKEAKKRSVKKEKAETNVTKTVNTERAPVLGKRRTVEVRARVTKKEIQRPVTKRKETTPIAKRRRSVERRTETLAKQVVTSEARPTQPKTRQKESVVKLTQKVKEIAMDFAPKPVVKTEANVSVKKETVIVTPELKPITLVMPDRVNVPRVAGIIKRIAQEQVQKDPDKTPALSVRVTREVYKGLQQKLHDIQLPTEENDTHVISVDGPEGSFKISLALLMQVEGLLFDLRDQEMLNKLHACWSQESDAESTVLCSCKDTSVIFEQYPAACQCQAVQQQHTNDWFTTMLFVSLTKDIENTIQLLTGDNEIGIMTI